MTDQTKAKSQKGADEKLESLGEPADTVPLRRAPAPAKTTRGKSARQQKAEASKKQDAGESNAAVPDLKSPEVYLNRELTWLNFNRRVLHEAQDTRNPLLERVKFLAITSSNLDEFFMKRIGGLKQQVATSVHELSVDGRTPQQQIAECTASVREIGESLNLVYADLVTALREQGIALVHYTDLSESEQAFARGHYLKNVLPLVTPLAMDPAHPFPFISNLSLNLLVTLRYHNESYSLMNRIKVPLGPRVPRFLAIEGSERIVPLEEVMAHNLDLLFPDMDIETCAFFRVTRNANTERDEDEAEDLLSMIQSELRYRKFAPFVRLEVGQGMSDLHRGMLAAELGLDEDSDVFETGSLMGMRDLMEIAAIDRPDLHDPDHHPITNTKLEETQNIFHLIRNDGPVLLHFPYESFATSVERFVREASRDPKVAAIKMTLYRTSADTEILEYLIDAARNGKQVAVAVELKARFDEAANIRWANRLEEVGIHVTYGVVGLKTHTKAILVVRQDFNGLRRYAHIGTGNYHAGTARIYADLGLLTCDDDIGHDLTELFNYLTSGCRPSRKYRKLLTAPKILKKALLSKIEREIKLHSDDTPGHIRLKTNALEDPDIVHALYKASQAGVTVDLIVRDTCRLRPGLPGVSDNVRVISVVSRFLEHARIYHFKNGGDDEYYIGSADLMTRNLESRVEAITPIEDLSLRSDLDEILKLQMEDTRNAWEMQSDGSYQQRQPSAGGRASKGSQSKLVALAEKRQAEANRLRRRRPIAMARRTLR